ncbi:hypothetical protein AB6A40_004368 [Gnathostoma spinigerum]|uniref:HEAT repeat domain-containing protein n=1 Tax=Gnathostoma spinigerum TaxID=75299 RepID=A0ABD6EJY4_9BILA
MLLLTDDYKWHPLYISVFQFVGLFRDKNPVPFIENVAHETWINKNLGSHQLYHIRDMMDRLLNVPIVPPLESLRHIALVLIDSDRRFQEIAEHYLKNARGQLRDDIVKGYLCLLEHDHAISRKAACRALYTLDSERGIWFLSHVAAYDRDPSVRDEAATALRKVQSHHDQDSSQVTRI